MNVLVAFEQSGVIRDAFRSAGHSAYSCDILHSETPSEFHIRANAFSVIPSRRWDMVIAHPPCTDLAVSGSRHFAAKIASGRQQQSIHMFMETWRVCVENAKMVAVENPIGVMSTYFRKPDQIIQPWMFGHPESKATCLWLRGLPVLTQTYNVRDEMLSLPVAIRNRVHHMPPGPNRWRERSRTFEGVALAMVKQWGKL